MLLHPASGFFYVTDYAVARILDEIKDDIYFFAHGDLLGYLDNGILKAEIGGVNNTIRIGDMPQHALSKALMLQHDRVHAMVARGITTKNDIGRNILLDAATALHQRITAHTDMLLDDDTGTEDSTVVNLTLSGYAGTDTYHTLVAYLHIMANMNLIHQEITVPDNGSLVLIGTAGYHDIFTDAVIIADNHMRLMALHVVKILWCSADNGILIHNIVTTHSRATQYTGMGHYDAIVAYYNILFDVRERLYFDIVSELSLRINVC